MQQRDAGGLPRQWRSWRGWGGELRLRGIGEARNDLRLELRRQEHGQLLVLLLLLLFLH